MRSPYPARRVPVDRTPSLPGAPRERRVRPLDGHFADRIAKAEMADDFRVTGCNPIGSDAAVWGAPVAPVTGRKSRKSPGWSSRIAGGSHIVAPGV